MELSVAANFDDRLLNELGKFKEVNDVYAKMHEDSIGGGRPSYLLPKVSRERLAEYVKLAHHNGIKFTYVLNSTCWAGKEFSHEWQEDFKSLLDFLVEAQVDIVTVATPYLLKAVHFRYPKLEINVSNFTMVNSVQRAKWYAENGATSITLDYISTNRDFNLLNALVKNINCDFQVLANDFCLFTCPNRAYHANLSSHSSVEKHKCDPTEYTFLNCTAEKLLRNPVEILKSGWIRPEDIEEYEKIGIKRFKIVDRLRPTDWMLKVVKAYVSRRMDGNLLELFNVPGSSAINLPNKGLQDLAKGGNGKIGEVMGALRSVSKNLLWYLDNQQLDGFIRKFKTVDCKLMDCKTCGHCQYYQKKALRLNKVEGEDSLEFPLIEEKFNSYIKSLEDGTAFLG